MAVRLRTRQGASAVGATAAATDAKPAERDLNDPVTQEKILNPEPSVVTIAGNEVKLYPLSAKRRRAFQVFCLDVVSNAAARSRLTITDKMPPKLVSRLISGQLSKAIGADEQLATSLCEFIARSEQPPGDIPDAAAIATRAAAIDDSCNDYREIARAFDVMFSLNEMGDLFPKPVAPPAKPTKKAG